jgi:hypothetical protein
MNNAIQLLLPENAKWLKLPNSFTTSEQMGKAHGVVLL